MHGIHVHSGNKKNVKKNVCMEKKNVKRKCVHGIKKCEKKMCAWNTCAQRICRCLCVCLVENTFYSKRTHSVVRACTAYMQMSARTSSHTYVHIAKRRSTWDIHARDHVFTHGKALTASVSAASAPSASSCATVSARPFSLATCNADRLA